MFGMILAVIILIAGFAVCFGVNKYRNTNYKEELSDWEDARQLAHVRYPNSVWDKPEPRAPEKLKFPAFIGLALAVVILIASCLAIVPTGYTGILTTFGKVENRTIPSGISFIAPWQNVIKMSEQITMKTSCSHAFRRILRLFSLSIPQRI